MFVRTLGLPPRSRSEIAGRSVFGSQKPAPAAGEAADLRVQGLTAPFHASERRSPRFKLRLLRLDFGMLGGGGTQESA